VAAGEPGPRDQRAVAPRCAPELSARRWDTPSLAARDQVALQIEKRLEELETAESWQKLTLRHQAWTPRSTLADRVTRYEAEATTLGAIPLETRAAPRRI